jgi:hypothetical protein
MIPNPIPVPVPVADVLHFAPDGTGAGLYTEAIDLQQIGRLDMSRASHIEFNAESQQWEVHDFTGRWLFADPSREACLHWEHQHFNQNSSS